MPHTHNRALSRRSCLNWWREEVRKRQRAIGRACWWWWCAAENWCWDGLTGSVSVHCKTVIQSDRVVFRSPPHKGYAIASSPHDRMNEPLLLQPEMLIRSVFKYLQPHSRSMSRFMGKSALALNISPCLWPIVRLRLHFRNDVLGNRVCWAVSSGCMILPAWLKSARELLPVPVHLLQLLVWSILDSFAQGCVCILTAESHRNKKKKRRGGGIDNVQIIYRQSCKFPRRCALGDAVNMSVASHFIQAQQIWNYAKKRKKMRSLYM